MSVREDQNHNLSKSIQKNIQEVMASVSTIDMDRPEALMEAGSYLHRVSPSVTELQSASNPPPNLTQILQSLSKNVKNAKDLIVKCARVVQLDPDEHLGSLIGKLERVINGIGEDLGKIPMNAFEDRKYAGTAINSIARDMRNAQLQISPQHTQANSDVQSIADSQLALPAQDPRIRDFIPRESNYGVPGNSTPAGPEHVEPLYDSFFCPLTKKLMTDPVTIESGVTYEKSAIAEVFEKQEGEGESLMCPVTGTKVESKVLNTNMALKSTISEWVLRNEAMRIRLAGNELMRGNMVYDAIQELKTLCEKRTKNIEQVHKSGITKMLIRYLESSDATIRCEALELLNILVKDDEGKEIMTKTKAIQRAAKLLSSNNSIEKHLALSFMLELSKSEFIVKMIGHTSGAILMLVTMKYNESADKIAAEKSAEILKNLEKRPKNIKYMALNGYLDPLLNNLVEGNEDMQMEIVGYLSELAQKQDISITIAAESRACEALIRMVRAKPNPNPVPTNPPANGEAASASVAPGIPDRESISNPMVRKAAFDVLVSISSIKPNAVPLLKAGVIPVMIEELFLRNNPSDGNPIPPKIDAAGVIANLLESGVGSGMDPEKILVNKNGHTLTSQYTIYNFAHMLKLSMPERLNINLIRILLALSTQPKPLAAIVSVARETEVIHTVIELLNSQSDDLPIVSTKLLVTLCPHIGHTIAERLCKTQGQPGSLVIKFESGRVTEKQAESANLLARLPHQNITLNLYLLHQGTMPVILGRIQEILSGGSLTSKYAKSYMEALVGILVRFTTTLYDPEIFTMVVETNLMRVFTEFLVRNAGSELVQIYACTGLMNLSSQSVNLSKPVEEQRRSLSMKKKGFLKMLSKSTAHKDMSPKDILVCPVHRGLCSASTTFCLIEANAVERLLGVLESDNGKVVGAALGALSTLLEDRVDVDKGVMIISESDGVRRVLRVLRDHREEGLWYKAFWVIERCITRGTNKEVQEISADRVLPGRLVSAFHSGDANTKQVADNILRRLHRMPDYSMSFVSMEM
ncbi:hypothetical protein LUZ60_000134 [Juncus effusus]|nr:hypothetical protein LUZ60_000134 [Juncus effusus]